MESMAVLNIAASAYPATLFLSNRVGPINNLRSHDEKSN